MNATPPGPSMTTWAIALGVGLVVVGVGATLASGSDSLTSLLPAAAGLVFLALGLVARRSQRLRRHILHGASALAVLLVLAGIGTLITRSPSGWALASQVATVVLTGLFAGLALRSMVAARRAQKAISPNDL